MTRESNEPFSPRGAGAADTKTKRSRFGTASTDPSSRPRPLSARDRRICSSPSRRSGGVGRSRNEGAEAGGLRLVPPGPPLGLREVGVIVRSDHHKQRGLLLGKASLEQGDRCLPMRLAGLHKASKGRWAGRRGRAPGPRPRCTSLRMYAPNPTRGRGPLRVEARYSALSGFEKHQALAGLRFGR